MDCQRVCDYLITCYEAECERMFTPAERAALEGQCDANCPVLVGLGCGFGSCEQAFATVAPVVGPVDAVCEAELPPADACDPFQVEDVFVGGSFAVDNRAVNNAIGGSCSASSHAVVYRLSLAAPQRVIISTLENDFDTVLSVRSECNDSATELACDDDGGAAVRSSQLVIDFGFGEHFILVHGYNGAQGTALLSIDAG